MHVGTWRAEKYLIVQNSDAAAEMVSAVGRISEAKEGFDPDRLAEEGSLSKEPGVALLGDGSVAVRTAEDELVSVLVDAQGGATMTAYGGWRAWKIFMHEVIAKREPRFEDGYRADPASAIVATRGAHVDVIRVDADTGAKNVEKLGIRRSQRADFNESASPDIRIGRIDMCRTGERIAVPGFANRASDEYKVLISGSPNGQRRAEFRPGHATDKIVYCRKCHELLGSRVVSVGDDAARIVRGDIAEGQHFVIHRQ